MGKNDSKLEVIDLFAGIGGFHLAFHDVGGKCVYASEWDEHARKTYEHNFKNLDPELFENDMFAGDITKDENKDKVPEDADVLCGGFPCQPFSQAGFKKGFEEVRGTLFFEIAQILRNKKPKAFFLENVRHLVNHNDGETFSVIKNILKNELGYTFNWKVVMASDHGLPTRRPRVFMVGFRNDIDTADEFEFPEKRELEFTMSDVLGGKCEKKVGYTIRVGGRRSGIDDRRNWDAYRVDGEVKVIGIEEGKKMMGFPDDFEFPVSKTQAMKQLGNSVAVNAIRDTAEQIAKVLHKHYEQKG